MCKSFGQSFSFLAKRIVKAAVLFCAIAQMNAQSNWPVILWPSFWNVQSPERIPNHLTAVAYGGGQWLAAGDHGTMLASEDGIHWNAEEPIVYNGVRGLHFADEQWIAVIDSSAILRAPDGRNWRASYSPEYYFRALHWAEGLWVAGAEKGLTTSIDGVNWISVADESFQNVIHDIYYHDGLWMAVGIDATILTSTDGGNWETRKIDTFLEGDGGSPEAVLTSVGFAQSRWHVAGAMETADGVSEGFLLQSEDGQNWEAVDFEATLPAVFDLAFEDDQGIAVGDMGLVLRLNETNEWTQMESPTTRWLYAATKGPDHWVAVGERGVILASLDGQDWQIISDPVQPHLNDIQFGDGNWLAMGEIGYALKSTDGDHWESLTLPDGPDMNAAHYGDGVWAGVGDGGALLTSNGLDDWQVRETPTQSDLHDIANGDGFWVAVGNDFTILESADLEQWSELNAATEPPLPQTADLNGIAYGNETWIAVGSDGIVMRSEDRLNWEVTFQQADLSINDVAYHDGEWIVVGDSGFYRISVDDGRNWSTASYTVTYPFDHLRVTYGNENWAIVGVRSEESSPAIGEPVDLNGGRQNYMHLFTYGAEVGGQGGSVTGFTGSLNGVAYGDGRWVAVGDYGIALDHKETVSYPPVFENFEPIIEKLPGPYIKISIQDYPVSPFPRVWEISKGLDQPFETTVNWPMIEWRRLTYRWRIDGEQMFFRLRNEE